jgi:hypothetical protein
MRASENIDKNYIYSNVKFMLLRWPRPAASLRDCADEPAGPIETQDDLIASVEDHEEQASLVEAINTLDHAAQAIRVKCGDTRMSMADLMTQCTIMREKPAKVAVLVHPGWAYHKSGWANLLERATASSHFLLDTQHKKLADAWRELHFEAMRRVVQGNRNAVFVFDPTPVPDSPDLKLDPSGRSTVFSHNIGEVQATGYLTAQALAQYMHLTSGTRPDDDTVIEGGTYGKCPTRFAWQLAATRLGIFLPHPSLAESPDCVERVVNACARAGMFRQSGIRFGNIIDCEGVHRAVQGKDEREEPTLQFCDSNTVIYPDMDTLSMSMARTRFC